MKGFVLASMVPALILLLTATAGFAMSFQPSTPSTTFPTTTLSTTTFPMECQPGDSKNYNCQIHLCTQHGRWVGFEFSATISCCNHIHHPKCHTFYPDLFPEVFG